MPEETLIGFDVREMWLEVNDLWPSHRKNSFLLKQDITKPLSVDPTVWQSIFDLEDTLLLGTLPRIIDWNNVSIQSQFQTNDWKLVFEGCKPLNLPDWIGPRGLWDDLDRLISHVDKAWSAWKPSWIIGVTEFIPDSDEEINYNITPSMVAEKWDLQGYDVADYYRTSFLSNAAYDSKEAFVLRASWPMKLNQYHLFSKLEDAMSYTKIAYQRDTNHGPFSVYGIYLIESRTELS